MPIKYLVFAFLLANMELPSHNPCPSVRCAVPSLSFSPIPPVSPTPEQPQAAAGTQIRAVLCTGRTLPSGTGRAIARLPFMPSAPSLGWAQRSAGPSPVSCYAPDPGSSPHKDHRRARTHTRTHTHTHTHTQKNHLRYSARSFIVKGKAQMSTTHGHALLQLPGWRNGGACPMESIQRPGALRLQPRLPKGHCQPLPPPPSSAHALHYNCSPS